MKALRYLARGISLAWAGFWVWFGIASGIGEGQGPLGVLMHTVPGLIFLASALVPWRWERPGGLLLVLEAPLIAAFFHVRHAGVMATLPLPALVAGLLFLAAGMGERPGERPAASEG